MYNQSELTVRGFRFINDYEHDWECYEFGLVIRFIKETNEYDGFHNDGKVMWRVTTNADIRTVANDLIESKHRELKTNLRSAESCLRYFQDHYMATKP